MDERGQGREMSNGFKYVGKLLKRNVNVGDCTWRRRARERGSVMGECFGVMYVVK